MEINYTTVPQGTYRCRLDEIRQGCTRAGDLRWSLRLTVTEGEHLGRQAAWDSLVFNTRGRARVRMFLKAFGLPATLAQLELDPTDLEGREAMVTVFPFTYTDVNGDQIVRNEVPYGGYAALPAV
jgi:hypothetical protein